MRLEQLLAGTCICIIIAGIGTLLSLWLNWILDMDKNTDSLGVWIAMIFMAIGFGICLAYIGYMKGAL